MNGNLTSLYLADDRDYVRMREFHHELNLFAEIVLVLLEHVRAHLGGSFDGLDGH